MAVNGEPMDLETRLLQLEEQFWMGDASYYRRNLTSDALMVFQEPVGTLTLEETVQAIAAAPRWAEVRFQDVRLVRLTGDAAIVTYKATARRDGSDPEYAALASSAYVSRDGSWKLAFHQQTPAAGVPSAPDEQRQ